MQELSIYNGLLIFGEATNQNTATCIYCSHVAYVFLPGLLKQLCLYSACLDLFKDIWQDYLLCMLNMLLKLQ